MTAETAALLPSLELAEQVAWHFAATSGQPVDELTRVASTGVAEAVGRFEPAGRQTFGQFAIPIITRTVHRHLRGQAGTQQPPRHVQCMQPELAAAVADLAAERRRPPRASEIAARIGVDVVDVIEALAWDGPSGLQQGNTPAGRPPQT